MKTRIMYLRDNNNPQGRGNPVGCLAIGLDSVTNPTKVSYQLSVLNPADKFDRDLARLKAAARLEGKPIELSVSLDKDFSSHEVASVVMNHLKNNKEAPARARRAANIWLKEAEVLAVKANLVAAWAGAVTRE
jgi:hypothetical protein